MGLALLEIRDSRLYRENYQTFEDYCRERWGIKKRYSHYLMEAAKVIKNLTYTEEKVHHGAPHPILNVDYQVIDPPNTERQARPLTQLDTPEEQREAWEASK